MAKLITSSTKMQIKSMPVASATVISAGQFIGEDGDNQAESATAAHTAIGYALSGSAAGEIDPILYVDDPDARFQMNADAALTATMRGETHDIVVTDGEQLLDVGETTTNVFRIDRDAKYGTVGSASKVVVRIAAPIN